MNPSIINELIQLLEQENRVYDDILKISKNKTNIIVEGKVNELENVVKLEQSLILQMSRVEGQREQLVQKLAAELKIRPSDLSISSLIEHISGEQAVKLKGTQEKMTAIISELKNVNELNEGLIKNSLDYINFSINVLTNAGDGTNNYGNGGQSAAPVSKPRSLFDVKL